MNLLAGSAEWHNSKETNLHDRRLDKGSVIVYVWRQRDAEVVADNLVQAGIQGGAIVYHGGMDASSRSKAYSKVRQKEERDELTQVVNISKPVLDTVYAWQSQGLRGNGGVWPRC